jgi:hypothetical protein
VSAVDQAADARLEEGGYAHRAGLGVDRDGPVSQRRGNPGTRGGAKQLHLGVGGRVAGGVLPVRGHDLDLAVGRHEDGAIRPVAASGRLGREPIGQLDELTGRGGGAHDGIVRPR